MGAIGNIARIVACVGLASIVGACAGTTAIPVSSDDIKTEGFRYAETKPILIVTSDGPEVVFIPNKDRQYAVRFYAFLAKNKSSMHLSNGMLTQIDADLDTTKIIDLLSQVLDKIAPDATDNAAVEVGGGDLLQVYDFVFDGNGNLIGLRKLTIT